MDDEHDVTIAGAGPTGLMLAAELALAGVRVVVLERKLGPDPALEDGAMGARALNAVSVEAFARRGLLAAVKARAQWWVDPEALRSQAPTFIGHFAGIPLHAEYLDRADRELAGYTLGGGVISIAALVEILAARAQALGVELRRGATLLRFSEQSEGVTIETDHGVLRSQWLVGCDGGRSGVRKQAGIAFPGSAGEIVGRQALVEFAHPEQLPVGDWVYSAHGAYAHGPPGRIHTVEYGLGSARDAAVTLAELEQSLQRVSERAVQITKLHVATRYTDTARQVQTYRSGRVLLAGDAAHIHSPAGGQGMNQGIGDAMNLGFKLAATVRGWAPRELLDTYTQERLPIGRWVQRWALAQSALGRPDAASRALREVVSELLSSTSATTYVMKAIAGVAHRYDFGSDNPLVGASAPALTLEQLGDGRCVLFDLRDDPELRASLAAWGERLRVVTMPASGNDRLSALLVRPDGYVAWAASNPSEHATCASALSLWLDPAT